MYVHILYLTKDEKILLMSYFKGCSIGLIRNKCQAMFLRPLYQVQYLTMSFRFERAIGDKQYSTQEKMLLNDFWELKKGTHKVYVLAYNIDGTKVRSKTIYFEVIGIL